MRCRNFKRSFVLIFAALVFSGSDAFAQQYGPINHTTLEARLKIDDIDNYTKAAFSFKYGINGDEVLPITRNNWDILYGNTSDKNGLSVSMIVDDRSRIIDLGKMSWIDNLELPELPCYEKPTRENDLPAIAGHIYMVHSCDRDTDHISLFRVDAVEPQKRVFISWVLVTDLFFKTE